MRRGGLHLRIEHARADAALLLVQQHRADLLARELPGAAGRGALEGAAQLGLGEAAQLELAEEARGEAGVEVLGVGGGEGEEWRRATAAGAAAVCVSAAGAAAVCVSVSRLLLRGELAGAGCSRWS